MSKRKMMNEQIARFLGQSILKYKDLKITFVPSESIKNFQATTTGWASATEIKIATGLDTESWVSVFVHETCHIDQSRQRPEWHEEMELAVGKLDHWMAGNKVDLIDSVVSHVIEMEWDCERRSIRKIKLNNLPFCLDDYIQKANAYILGYHWTRVHRKWCQCSYKKESIWKSMPKKLISLKQALNPPPKLIAPFYD